MLNNENIKSLLNQTKRDAFMMGFLPSERVNIEISADVETACWSFIPPHRIVVGNEKNHSHRSDNFIQSLLWHELSHAKWTERDFEKINEELRDKKVPFKLYNLFEDARIEHLFREETGKKFNWIKDIPNKEALTPVEMFYSFVNNEGVYEKANSFASSFSDVIELRLLYVGQGVKKQANTYFSINNQGKYSYDQIEVLLRNTEYTISGIFCIPKASTTKSNMLLDSFVKTKPKKPHGSVTFYQKGKRIELVSYDSENNPDPFIERVLHIDLACGINVTFNKVVEFYNKACNALSSMEIIDICAEWIREFPDSLSDDVLGNYEQGDRGERKGKGKGKGRGDILSPEEMEYIAGESISGDENNSSDKEEINEMLSILLKGSNEGLGRILQGIPETFDETRLNKLTQLFKGIIKRGMVKYNSIIPSKKLNIRNYTLGSDKIFKKQQYDNGKSEKLSVILDCSGSMSGSHLYAGKELLIIINRLAKQGLIRGNIILTESSEQVLLPMPVDEKIIHSIQTGGGEGFKTTIEKYGNVLKESGKVFIFTDGEIGDEPDSDYNRKLGIKTYGLYVGEKDQTAQLKKFFNEAISKTSLEDVINELLKIVK